ncbi:macrophage mannose receptor 1-like isoform X1 [Carassius gibelio]|uniref:macrophage mannose receptor 1-like isoform X1 n=1 Tax=Carassius gibelio TaxID=101364 RepID=UPI0022796C93|nr:macrophage mannose receptor 1-like isoform X1 [Carassius gibelio]
MIQNKIQLVVFLAGILSKASCDLYQIVLIQEPKTWTEAQSYCREKYTDLATVQSDEDRAKLKEAANAVNFQSLAWIGFYREVWHWSYQNTPISYVTWDTGNPDVPVTDEACVGEKPSGQWGDRYCTDQYNFFCQTDKQDTLQNKFKLIGTNMNWYDAQIYCRANYVDLATISDNTENTFLAKVLSDLGILYVWIGLHRTTLIPSIPWQWSDNSSVSLSSVKWVSGQPDVNGNKDCAKANTGGLMSDDSCLTPLPFYCREFRKKIQRVRFTIKSHGQLDESVVMEAIEKKMKEILSDQDTSSINWSVQPDGKIFQQQKTQENTQEKRC